MTAPSDRPLAARLADALGDAYTIEGEIGRGGMGVVYRARDERLQRRVAIKVLPPELAFQQDIRQRFTREAQTAARLSHPHIVPIHSVGEGQNLVYFVMGYVDGESLAARIRRRGPLPVEEVRRIMKETADALGAAHALSVIHRDIKPDNILLEGTRGRVMVTDFGIAKALSTASGATLTGVGVAIGTPAFMSPEQAAGERNIDGRSDLYSLGVVTYQMLTGKLPFNAPSVAGILMKQITEAAPDIRRSRPDIPEDLALAVARCLEKDPESRWPTADALRRALETRNVGDYRPTSARRAASAGQRGGEAGFGRSSLPGSRSQKPGKSPARSRRCLAAAVTRRSPVPIPAAGGPPRSAGSGSPGHRRAQDHSESSGTVRQLGGSSAGCMGINVATGLEHPWFLFPMFGMGIGLMRNYATLWSGWVQLAGRAETSTGPGRGRDDDDRGQGGRQLPAPNVEEYRISAPGGTAGTQRPAGHSQADVQAAGIRTEDAARGSADSRCPLLPGHRPGEDLARHGQQPGYRWSGGRSTSGSPALSREPDDPERARRLNLLERQRQTISDLRGRRSQVAGHLESCVLAMQNVRFDLLRLRSAGVAAVLGDLTQATQQARSLSRDVDNVIAAAGEIREAMK